MSISSSAQTQHVQRVLIGVGLGLVLIISLLFGGRQLTMQPAEAAGAYLIEPVATVTHTPTPAPLATVGDMTATATSFQVANLPGDVARYDAPNGKQVGTVPGSWYGYQSKLLIINKTTGWLQVRLQRRPNEDTAWIKSAGITITTTPYRIVVNITTHTVILYKDGVKVFSAPAGVGKASTPTPTGHFFVAFLNPPLSAGYAPIMLFLSAHSNAISDYEGSGDAITAIHGPVGSDAQIGTTGAAISHGCIRMHSKDLANLEVVLAGSPVDITA